MRLSRVAVLLPIVLAVGAVFLGRTTALDGNGSPSASDPSLTLTADASNQTIWLEAVSNAPAGTPGALDITIVQRSTQNQVNFLKLVDFDASGKYRWDVPFSTFDGLGGDVAVSVRVVTPGANNTILTSPLWSLLVDDYVVGNPSSPPPADYPSAPGFGSDLRPLPGTEAPLFPFSWAVIPGAGYGTSSVFHLTLYGCAPGGPAGSFPIN